MKGKGKVLQPENMVPLDSWMGEFLIFFFLVEVIFSSNSWAQKELKLTLFD